MKRLLISLILLPLLTSCDVEESYYEPEEESPPAVIVHPIPERPVYRSMPNEHIIRHSAPEDEVVVLPPTSSAPRNVIRHAETPHNIIRHS